MKVKDFDREKNPAAQVGIWYNEEDNRYYIVIQYHYSEEFKVIEPYILGILDYPSSNVRLASAVSHAKQYVDCFVSYAFVGFVSGDLVIEASSVEHCRTSGEAITVAKRKYNGKEYTFVSRGFGEKESWTHDAFPSVWCESPKNCFGYPDYLRLASDGSVWQEWRSDVPTYIRKKVGKVLKELEEVGDYYLYNQK